MAQLQPQERDIQFITARTRSYAYLKSHTWQFHVLCRLQCDPLVAADDSGLIITRSAFHGYATFRYIPKGVIYLSTNRLLGDDSDRSYDNDPLHPIEWGGVSKNSCSWLGLHSSLRHALPESLSRCRWSNPPTQVAKTEQLDLHLLQEPFWNVYILESWPLCR